MRALAQRSAVAAREITGLIQDSSNQTTKSLEKATHGVEIFEGVLKSISNLSSISTEIAKGSQEQSQGLNQISAALNQLDQLSQANAKNASETADSAESLSTETESLRESLEKLQRLAGTDAA